MTTSPPSPSASEGARGPSSQEAQLQLILRRVWTELSGEWGLAEMSLDERAVLTPFDFAVRKRAHWTVQLERWRNFAFVQQNASDLARVEEILVTMRTSEPLRSDLREALWRLDRLRRARSSWDARFSTHGVQQQLRRFARGPGR